jgi:hypothetical protein
MVKVKEEMLRREECMNDNTEPSKVSRGDGGDTYYYELPEGATQLRHLIKYKKMEHGIGEAFCALYRLNDNGEYLRNLNKVKNYIDAEIEWAKYNV